MRTTKMSTTALMVNYPVLSSALTQEGDWKTVLRNYMVFFLGVMYKAIDMRAHYGYNGLREREHYDEIVGYLIGGQEMIRYPDRFAKQIRNSPYLTQLDGDGYMEMVELEEKLKRQQALEQLSQVLRFQFSLSFGAYLV